MQNLNIGIEQAALDANRAGNSSTGTGKTGDDIPQSGSNQNVKSHENQNNTKDIPLVFMRESELFGTRKPEKTEWLQHVEIFKAIGKRIDVTHISGLQRVRGMWRIYLDNLQDKVKLMSDGIPIRGKVIPVLNTNPDRLDGENTTRIRVKNIPLSADDGIIKRELTLKGAEVITMFREKLRVDGKLTNCETGDRVVIVKSSSLKEPLPTFITFGTFTGRVFHPGQSKQNTNKRLKCNKCLEDGHTFANCTNDWVCTVCKKSGHKRYDCPGEDPKSDAEDDSESETSEEESESETSEQVNATKSPVKTKNPPNKSDQEDRRKVKAERKQNRQSSIENFMTPMKTGNSNNKDRSPPTPAEEMHDALLMTKKKQKKNNKEK